MAELSWHLRLFPLAVPSGDAGDRANSRPDRAAVVDFMMAGEEVSLDPWASGVADLLDIELQQQGVPVMERRQIRRILAERRLSAMGGFDWRRLAQEKHSQIQCLISGEMTRTDPSSKMFFGNRAAQEF